MSEEQTEGTPERHYAPGKDPEDLRLELMKRIVSLQLSLQPEPVNRSFDYKRILGKTHELTLEELAVVLDFMETLHAFKNEPFPRPFPD